MSIITTASNVHSRMIHNTWALFLRVWEEILSRTQLTEKLTGMQEVGEDWLLDYHTQNKILVRNYFSVTNREANGSLEGDSVTL